MRILGPTTWIVGLWVVLGTVSVHGQDRFATGTILSNVAVGQHAAPCVADWNNDGKKDLIAGYFGSGLKVYLNNNTDADPAFTSYAMATGFSIPPY